MLLPDSRQSAKQQTVFRLKMKRTLVILAALLATLAGRADAAPKPNVLVIVIDDLNDWLGCLGGHPQVKTPHIDRLAKRGVLFSNAHVQATYCGPSRVSFLSGRMPQTTGSRDMSPYSGFASLKDHPPFPLHFRRQGYETYGGGKIFHGGTGTGWVAESWVKILPSGRNPRPAKPIHWQKRVWDWGPLPGEDCQMADYRLAQEAAKTVRQPHDKPFFVVAGIRRPHVPLHVPQMWFDMYPLDTIILPEVLDDDLDDVPHPEMGLNFYAAPEHSVIVERKLWRSLVQAYLASISFVDHCVGEMLNGLEQGPNNDNTIVILFSDHGFHLGEKQHWAKRTLWEETTRVPLIIAGPGIQAGQCDKAVGLIDLYPTLCELTASPMPAGLDGHSLGPLLNDPDGDWRHAAYCTFEPGDLSVRTEHWRYIRHPDGAEELYDHRTDAHEWHNLAGNSDHALVQQRHADLAKAWR